MLTGKHLCHLLKIENPTWFNHCISRHSLEYFCFQMYTYVVKICFKGKSYDFLYWSKILVCRLIFLFSVYFIENTIKLSITSCMYVSDSRRDCSTVNPKMLGMLMLISILHLISKWSNFEDQRNVLAQHYDPKNRKSFIFHFSKISPKVDV